MFDRFGAIARRLAGPRIAVPSVLGVLFFVALFLLVPRISLPGGAFGLTGGAILVDLVATSILTVILWVGASLVGHKVKEIGEVIGMKDCEACVRGKIDCKDCAKSGSREQEVTEPQTCPSCGGTGQGSQGCQMCTGSGSIVRPGRFSTTPGAPSVRRDWNLLHFGHFQNVAVGVTNTDEVRASYSVTVSVAGGAPSSLTASITLEPGQSATPTFEFKVHGGAPRGVQSTVSPSPVTVRCPSCSGRGTVPTTCFTCSGAGKVPVNRTVRIRCDTCSGSGVIDCSVCHGSGRVHRVD